MKIIDNRFLSIITFVIMSILFFSCEKSNFTSSYPGYTGKVMMAQAADGRNSFSIPMSSKPWKLGFGASFGGSTRASPSDIPVEFALKEEWVANFNQQNGTNYVLLPKSSYSITGFSSTIKKGNTTSEPLSISIESKKLDISKRYMFPITLLSAGNEKIDSALHTAWFRIENIVRPERDVTSQATLSVSHENTSNANENSPKLVDNNSNTKFLLFDAQPKIAQGLWFQLSFPNPIVLGAYTITSANDAPDRDLKNWQFQGSDNGTNWTTLDTQNGQSFSARFMTIRYEFANSTAYKYYRILVGANNGGNLYQQAEWRVIEFFEQ